MAEQEAHWYTSSIQSVDAKQYPKIYCDALGWRIFKYVIGVPLLVLGFIGLAIILLARGAGIHDFAAEVFLIFLLLFVFVFGLYEVLSARRSKIILLEDAIEVYGVTGSNRLRKEQIAGWRLLVNPRGSNALILEPFGHNLKKIRVPRDIQKDSVFIAWAASLPNLDAKDMQQAEAEIAADESLGATKEERLESLARARKFAKRLSWTTYGLMAVAVFHPHSYAVAVFSALAIMPFVAVVVQIGNPKLYALFALRNQAQARLTEPFLLPGFSLMWWAIAGTHLVDWRAALGLAVISALSMGGVAIVADPALRQRKGAAILVMLLMGSYGYGAGVVGDAVTDTSMPQTFHVAVLGKHIVTGRHRSYEIKLAPWGPIQDAGDVSVNWSLYQQVNQGSVVCTNLRPGSIGIAWYNVTSCN